MHKTEVLFLKISYDISWARHAAHFCKNISLREEGLVSRIVRQ